LTVDHIGEHTGSHGIVFDHDVTGMENITADTLQGGHNAVDGYHGITDNDTVWTEGEEIVGAEIGVLDVNKKTIALAGGTSGDLVTIQIKNGLITYFKLEHPE